MIEACCQNTRGLRGKGELLPRFKSPRHIPQRINSREEVPHYHLLFLQPYYLKATDTSSLCQESLAMVILQPLTELEKALIDGLVCESQDVLTWVSKLSKPHASSSKIYSQKIYYYYYPLLLFILFLLSILKKTYHSELICLL